MRESIMYDLYVRPRGSTLADVAMLDKIDEENYESDSSCSVTSEEEVEIERGNPFNVDSHTRKLSLSQDLRSVKLL